MKDLFSARRLSLWLSFALPLLYLLVSFSFYLRTYDSAQIKITLVQMGGTFLITLWYIRLLCTGEIPFKKHVTLIAPLLVSLLSGLISWLHTPYPGPSIDECLRRVFYVHFALITIHEFYVRERLDRLFKVLIWTTALSVAYGMVQLIDWRFPSLHLDPFIWRGAFGARIFSTYGNPNFYGNFLVIVAPIVLALLLRKNRAHPISVFVFSFLCIAISGLLWKWNFLMGKVGLEKLQDPLYLSCLVGFSIYSFARFSNLGVLFFLVTLNNIQTESKGAWIGYAAGFVIFLLLVTKYFSRFQSPRVKQIIYGAVFGTLLIGVLGVTIQSRARMDSIRFRVVTWASTFEMAMMDPIFGNGVGSFRVLYPAFRRPQIFHIEAKHNTETDHAENEFWEVFQDEGLIGFGLFMWLLVVFSKLGLTTLARLVEDSVQNPDDPKPYYLLGILSAFWAMLIHNQMDVSLRFVSSGIYLWLLIGLIGAIGIYYPMSNKDDSANESDPSSALPNSVSWGLRGVAILSIACIGWWEGAKLFPPLSSLVNGFIDAQGILPPYPMGISNPTQILQITGERILWVVSWGTFISVLGLSIWLLIKLIPRLKNPIALVFLVVMTYPLQVFWNYFRADVYHNRGIFFSRQQQWEQAIAHYEQALRWNPNYIMSAYFLGNVYADRWQPGDLDRALEAYRRVWRIAPNYVQTHHQAGLLYMKNGSDIKNTCASLMSQGRRSEVPACLDQAEASWKQSIVYFQKYHAIDPVYEPNYLRWAWVLIQLSEIANLRGQAALRDQYANRAEDLYRESIEARVCGAPENDVLHENWKETHRHSSEEVIDVLGAFLAARNQINPALETYEKALSENPESVRLLKGYTNLLIRLRRTSDVQKAIRRMLVIAPNDPDVQRIAPLHGIRP